MIPALVIAVAVLYIGEAVWFAVRLWRDGFRFQLVWAILWPLTVTLGVLSIAWGHYRSRCYR